MNKEVLSNQALQKTHLVSYEVFDRRLEEYLKPSQKKDQQISLNLINTRLWLNDLGQKYNKKITIDTIPDEEWAEKLNNYDIFWFMGIYLPSQFSANHAKKYTHQYTHALPDIDPNKDVVASPFAVADYLPSPHVVESWEAWDKMVEKLHKADKKVYVDFVPNHTAVDHPWATEHPEYFIQSNKEQFLRHPNLYQAVNDQSGQTHYLAHGKDPNYPEWSDTLQLNYGQEAVHHIMTEKLLSLVEHVDGVRCDMAMLLNSSTFLRTWGWTLNEEEKQYIQNHQFWQEAIPKAKAKAESLKKDDFEFMAEAYWEKDILAKDFDFIYRDELYKHLLRVARGEKPHYLREHIAHLLNCAQKQEQCKDTVYLENHDEERAVKIMGKDFSKAAAALISFLPNTMLLINQGQEDGRSIRPPMQISRSPKEKNDLELKNYYQRLMELKQSKLFREGQWSMAQVNTSSEDLISLEVQSSNRVIKAIICINIGKDYVSGEIPMQSKYKPITTFNLNSAEYSCLEQRNTNLNLNLAPFTSQIIFFSYNRASA
jgi:glycosidase